MAADPTRQRIGHDIAEAALSALRAAARALMEMKRLAGGNLRAAGYDAVRRVLVVELTSGTFEHGGVSADTYRRLASASSPWSFYRDNIDEEYPAKRVR